MRTTELDAILARNPQLSVDGWEKRSAVALPVAKRSRSELEEQKVYHNWLLKNNVYVINPQSNKKSTIRKGHPDYTLFAYPNRVMMIEMKAPGQKPRPEQQACIDQLRTMNFVVMVVYSALEAIEVTRVWLGQGEGSI